MRGKLKTIEASKKSIETELKNFESKFAALKREKEKSESELSERLATLEKENSDTRRELGKKLEDAAREIENAQERNLEMKKQVAELEQALKKIYAEKDRLEDISAWGKKETGVEIRPFYLQ